ncbi:MAG TPA: tryptophan halogenase family protein [Brevundimonas sp.]|uniref:tryptophan halogenase family protein n=1 Tax=Brevundimonas sp. TaxID=1871086 RepID=UPI002E0EBC87|nr:tryptophan halogenase family protein [Brevundimonas sp.]
MTDLPPGAVRRVVILGGGTAGWMTAAALGRLIAPTGVEVTLIESEEIGTVGVGESTLPHLRDFNLRLGIDEAEFMRATRATFKLGIEFCDWGRLGDRYMHPFGDFGAEGGGVPFHHYWLAAQARGEAGPLDDYAVPIVAAYEDRFAPPKADARSVLSTYGYAYQLDAGLYAAFLRRLAEAAGVRRVEGRVVDVAQDGDRGAIVSLRLADGQEIAGDLFVDCSGFRGLLIEQTLKAGYADWSHWLPCDRAVAIPCESVGRTQPYTRAIAMPAGWRFRIPLQHRIGNGYVYCSAFETPEGATAALEQALEGAPRAAPNHLRFLAGHRKLNWASNCVAIGLSSGFIEPLESTSIYLIQAGITKLVELWPRSPLDTVSADEFNRQMMLQYERIRDFIILHYVATERDDTPFWRHIREMTIPDSLATRIELFRETGVVSDYREGLFLHASWVAVLLGQRIMPRTAHVLARAEDPQRLAAGLARLRRMVAEAGRSLPLQDDYIAAHCAWRPPSGQSAA